MNSPRFDAAALFEALDQRRWALAIEKRKPYSWREVARDCGCSPSLFVKIGKHGQPPSVPNLLRLLAWLGETDLKPYISDGEASDD